jgi:phosphate transport system substrate-binding protein
VPSSDANSSSDRARTPRGLVAAGASFLGALAGCSSLGSGSRTNSSSEADGRPGTATTPSATGNDQSSAELLTVQTSGTLADAVQRGAGLWNANPAPTSDRLVWAQLGAQPSFDDRLADHFAAAAELSRSGERADPPFRVATGLAALEESGGALADGTVDAAGLGSPWYDAEPTEYVGGRADAVVRHPVGRDGWVFVVSPALAEAGVGPLTVDQLRRVFAGDVTSWRAFGGPDAEPFVFLGPDVSGDWDPAYEAFLLAGDTVPELDYRAGQASQLVTVAAERDDALGVVPASGVGLARARGVPTLDVVVDGERADIYDADYPTVDDVHLYTVGETDARERAFLDLLTSPFGQRALVRRDLLPLDSSAG